MLLDEPFSGFDDPVVPGMSHDDLAEAAAWGIMHGSLSACSDLMVALRDVLAIFGDSV
jgi:hypothetical protein